MVHLVPTSFSTQTSGAVKFDESCEPFVPVAFAGGDSKIGLGDEPILASTLASYWEPIVRPSLSKGPYLIFLLILPRGLLE
ncbi:hypothetical protein Nepgr_009822 [Nepenthes gracilis]|uniref:Uncharacterized protein n=1 Tax=Nepenthes gracilis TaxID=150966 RepID=A0AAD3SC31_NEPGR|nr:hypothetical protein Nepgr_009822 [Nepenthes gracilis]